MRCVDGVLAPCDDHKSMYVSKLREGNRGQPGEAGHLDDLDDWKRYLDAGRVAGKVLPHVGVSHRPCLLVMALVMIKAV